MTNQRDRADFADDRRRRVAMRKTPPEGERLLWYKLRNRYLHGLKFRRQHQIGSYIADFYCDERQLVVEVDGWQHFDNEGLTSDEARTRYLESLGLHVVRFTNAEVLSNLDAVLEPIRAAGSPSPRIALLSPASRALSQRERKSSA